MRSRFILIAAVVIVAIGLGVGLGIGLGLFRVWLRRRSRHGGSQATQLAPFRPAASSGWTAPPHSRAQLNGAPA